MCKIIWLTFYFLLWYVDCLLIWFGMFIRSQATQREYLPALGSMDQLLGQIQPVSTVSTNVDEEVMARLSEESLTSPVTAGVTEMLHCTTTSVSGCSVTALQSVPSVTTAPNSGQSLTKPIDTTGLMRAIQSMSTPAVYWRIKEITICCISIQISNWHGKGRTHAFGRNALMSIISRKFLIC